MKVQIFDLELIKLKEASTGYYMLQVAGKHSDFVEITVNTVNGEVPFEDFSAFRMNDGKVLIAIHLMNKVFADCSLTATDTLGTTEVINTQTYERLYQYYNLPASENKGFFIFENSVPVPPDGYGWRCDSNRFGPQFFMKNDVEYDPLFADLSEIIVYEPVLSVSGTAHIVYVNGTRDAELEDFHLEEYELPRATRTLHELFKLITEWSDVSLPPWNNEETIAVKAKEFLQKMQFSSEFIADVRENQIDMQVVKYLKGSADARARSSSPAPLPLVADAELKKKVSHLSLPNILALFDNTVDDIDSVIEFEEKVVSKRQNALINELELSLEKFTTADINTIVQAMQDKTKTKIRPPVLIYITTLAVRREILDNAIN
jgi:hypothetical protein